MGYARIIGITKGKTTTNATFKITETTDGDSEYYSELEEALGFEVTGVERALIRTWIIGKQFNGPINITTTINTDYVGQLELSTSNDVLNVYKDYTEVEELKMGPHVVFEKLQGLTGDDAILDEAENDAYVLEAASALNKKLNPNNVAQVDTETLLNQINDHIVVYEGNIQKLPGELPDPEHFPTQTPTNENLGQRLRSQSTTIMNNTIDKLTKCRELAKKLREDSDFRKVVSKNLEYMEYNVKMQCFEARSTLPEKKKKDFLAFWAEWGASVTTYVATSDALVCSSTQGSSAPFIGFGDQWSDLEADEWNNFLGASKAALPLSFISMFSSIRSTVIALLSKQNLTDEQVLTAFGLCFNVPKVFLYTSVGITVAVMGMEATPKFWGVGIPGLGAVGGLIGLVKSSICCLKLAKTKDRLSKFLKDNDDDLRTASNNSPLAVYGLFTFREKLGRKHNLARIGVAEGGISVVSSGLIIGSVCSGTAVAVALGPLGWSLAVIGLLLWIFLLCRRYYRKQRSIKLLAQLKRDKVISIPFNQTKYVALTDDHLMDHRDLGTQGALLRWNVAVRLEVTLTNWLLQGPKTKLDALGGDYHVWGAVALLLFGKGYGDTGEVIYDRYNAAGGLTGIMGMLM
jgi:hypothetical protein